MILEIEKYGCTDPNIYGLWGESRAVELTWIFPGAPLTFNWAPGNIQGNLTGM